ncbi:DNA topoisomerase 3-alpha [Bienertia sinuspersici]
MASSQNSSGSESSQPRHSRQQIYCFHNELAPLRVVKHHGPTFGKRFYGCRHWPSTCGFFKWAEETDDFHQLQMALINKNIEIVKLEAENKSLKEQLARTQDLVDELSIECTERQVMMEAVTQKKIVVYALVFSWVFFSVYLLCH